MSPEEFNQVFRALLPEVSKFLARRLDASDVEDIASDLFELAWSKRDKIEKGQELPWLYKSARYLISNHYRKTAGRSRISRPNGASSRAWNAPGGSAENDSGAMAASCVGPGQSIAAGCRGPGVLGRLFHRRQSGS